MLVYKVNPEEKRIKNFGEDFVKNNKDKAIMRYNHKSYKLNEYFSIKNFESDYLYITLIGLEKKSDKSYMFHKCNLLENYIILENNKDNDNKYLKTDSVKDIDPEGAKKYEELYSYVKGDIYKTESIIKDNNDMSNILSMLKGYKILSFLPDKNGWKTSSCYNMEHLFDGCSSLISLPDISKWNTTNVSNMSYVFNGCSSLLTLPDISEWDTSNVTDMSYMFGDCTSLKSLPDLSKWCIDKVINLEHMFDGCSELSLFPDLSKWETNQVKNK